VVRDDVGTDPGFDDVGPCAEGRCNVACRHSFVPTCVRSRANDASPCPTQTGDAGDVACRAVGASEDGGTIGTQPLSLGVYAVDSRGLADPFFSVVCTEGVRGDAIGGLDDRRGTKFLCFDIDGTRQAVIQRSVPRGESYVGGKRRATQAVAPGYTGRRRGDAVRTRITVQQAHTSEWLGVFGAAGNGSLETLMEPVLRTVSKYLASRMWPMARTLLRFDGEHGRFPEVHRLVNSGMGFVVRGVVYSLLNDSRIRSALAAGTTVSLTHPDTGVTRQLFDVPGVVWKSGDKQCTVRVIVARGPKPDRPVRIGKLIGEHVYELFVTTAEPECFHAADIVSMYLHRGQFEATLAQEDREVPADHWLSYSPHGQEIWQIVCQWVWNLDLWLGLASQQSTSVIVRSTDFTPRVDVLGEAVCVSDLNETPDVDHQEDGTVSSGAEVEEPTPSHSATITPAQAPSESPSDALTFRRDQDGTMRCPTGQPMRLVETRKLKGSILRQRLQADSATCGACSLRAPCRGANAESIGGRRINVAPEQTRVDLHRASRRVIHDRSPIVPPSQTDPVTALTPGVPLATTVPAAANTSIRWYDLPAREIRTHIQHGLESLFVQVLPQAPTQIARPVQTEPERDQRAHRRHHWLWSISRNALPLDQPRNPIRIHGLPPNLASALRISVRT
jgi:hypothetical protein